MENFLSKKFVKVLSLHDKYNKVVSAICDNNIAMVKVGSEDGSCFVVKSGVD